MVDKKGLLIRAQNLLQVELVLPISFFLVLAWEWEGVPVSDDQTPPTLTSNACRSLKSTISRAVVLRAGCTLGSFAAFRKKLQVLVSQPRPFKSESLGWEPCYSCFWTFHMKSECATGMESGFRQEGMRDIPTPALLLRQQVSRMVGSAQVGLLASKGSLASYYQFRARLNVEASPTLSSFYPQDWGGKTVTSGFQSNQNPKPHGRVKT